MRGNLKTRIDRLEEKAAVSREPAVALTDKEIAVKFLAMKARVAARRVEEERRAGLSLVGNLKLARQDLHRMIGDRKAGEGHRLLLKVRFARRQIRHLEVGVLRENGFDDEKLMSDLYCDAEEHLRFPNRRLVDMPEAAQLLLDRVTLGE